MQMQNIQNQAYTKPRTKTFDLVITAILAALIFTATLINIKLTIRARWTDSLRDIYAFHRSDFIRS